MKFRWTSTYTKWSIAFFCVTILVCSVYKDMSFQKVCKKSKLQNNQKDSLLLMNVDMLDSLRYDIVKMADSVNVHYDMLDVTLQQHIIDVDSTTAAQNRLLDQIRRELNQ